MTREGRLIARFAVAGLTIAIVTAICMGLHGPNYLINLLILITPTMVLFQPAAWKSVGSTLTMFAVLAIGNAWVYAIVGAIFAALPTKAKH